MSDQPIEPSEPTEPTQPPAKGPRVRRVVALAVAIVLVAGASATAGYLWVMRGSDEALITRVPADFDLFMTVYLDPSAAQKRNLERIAGEFPALGSGHELSANVNEALDDALDSLGIRSEDVRPWLGSQVGFAMDLPSSLLTSSEPRVALLVDVSDEAGAEAALEKAREEGSGSAAEYEGVAIWNGEDRTGSPASLALVDGTVVLASDQGVVEDVIDVAQGKTPDLASSETFARTEELLPEERIALFYMDFGWLADLIAASGGLSAAQLGSADAATLQSLEGMGMTLSAQPEGIALDMAIATDPSKLSAEERASLAGPKELNPLLEWVPDDAYLVTADASYDETLKGLVDQIGQRDPGALMGMEMMGITGEHGLIEGMNGDVVLVAGPGTVPPFPAGAVILGVDDEAGFESALSRLEPMVAKAFAGEKVKIDAKGKLHVVKTPPPEWDSRLHGEVTIHFLPVKDTAEAGVALSYAVTDGAAIIASSPDEVERLLDTHAGGTPITQNPGFEKAMEEVGGPEGSIVYADLAGIVDAIRNVLPPDERSFFDLSVGPNLDPLVALAASGDSNARASTARIFIVIA